MAKIAINLTTGSLQKEEMIVGIDLGTTNSLVAIIHPETKQPVVLKEFDNSSLVPSVVHFPEAGEPIVGDAAKEYVETDPARTVFSAKRLMGKSYNDISALADFYSYKVIDDNTDSLVKVQVGNTFYSPVELSSLILKELKKRAEHILKTPVTKAVITVPAYFNDAQRQATRDAGKLAGLDVLRIVNEPTAASLAYGIGTNTNDEKTIAVYDLGGGTFDVSILRITNGIFEVLSTNGDTYLGGDDFDNVLVKWLINDFKEKEGIDLSTDIQALQRLTEAAEKAKIELSTVEKTTISLAFITADKTGPKHIEKELTKETFESLCKELINRCRLPVEKALSDARLEKSDINEVVLVGG